MNIKPWGCIGVLGGIVLLVGAITYTILNPTAEFKMLPKDMSSEDVGPIDLNDPGEFNTEKFNKQVRETISENVKLFITKGPETKYDRKTRLLEINLYFQYDRIAWFQKDKSEQDISLRQFHALDVMNVILAVSTAHKKDIIRISVNTYLKASDMSRALDTRAFRCRFYPQQETLPVDWEKAMKTVTAVYDDEFPE